MRRGRCGAPSRAQPPYVEDSVGLNWQPGSTRAVLEAGHPCLIEIFPWRETRLCGEMMSRVAGACAPPKVQIDRSLCGYYLGYWRLAHPCFPMHNPQV